MRPSPAFRGTSSPKTGGTKRTEYDYEVIEGGNPRELARKVHHMIDTHGWRCQGGVATTVSYGVDRFYQAMVSPRVATVKATLVSQ